MNTLIDWVLGLVVLALALPCAVFTVQCALACLSFRKRRTPRGERPSIAIIMPAHDEAAIIESTLAPLLCQLRAQDRLLVVADNCTDDTAQRCRDRGAEVVERHDPERRGKGYALVYGIQRLAEAPPSVVIIVDADCTVEPGALDLLAEQAVEHNGPVQADYVLSLPDRPSSLAVISALAFIVKNRVRPLGMHTLGLPCALTGTGMAFPFDVLANAPPTEGHLVEDMVMGIDLALAGHAPRLCPDAHVLSGLPGGDSAAAGQRRRWEHGHLATIKEHVPRLVFGALSTGRLGLLGMALDLLVPPLALLVLLTSGVFGVSVGWACLGGSPLPAYVAGSGLLGVGLAVLFAWARFARSTLPLWSLLTIPFYILWKVPLYVAFAIRGRHKSWDRTDRVPKP